ncbi:MAG: nuclear transport factor 2 family protein [Parasphingopyxis sp.]
MALAAPAAIAQTGGLPQTVPLPPPGPYDQETEHNRAVIEQFARLFYIEGKVREAFETYVREDYIQHNPRAADGREAAIEMLQGLLAGSTDRQFEIQRIIVDGPFAVVHSWSRADAEDRGHAVVDIFRIEDGLLAEHWDVIQPVPEEAANDHPMF